MLLFSYLEQKLDRFSVSKQNITLLFNVNGSYWTFIILLCLLWQYNFTGFILKFFGEADGFNLKKSYIQLGKILHDPPYLIQNSSDLGHFEIKIPFLAYFYYYYLKKNKSIFCSGSKSKKRPLHKCFCGPTTQGSYVTVPDFLVRPDWSSQLTTKPVWLVSGTE